MLQTCPPGGFTAWKAKYPLAPGDARGPTSKFCLEADVIRPTDDVVGRRVGGERLAAHERRTFIADVREPGHQLEVVDDGPVRIEIEVVVSPHTRGGAGPINDHILT